MGAPLALTTPDAVAAVVVLVFALRGGMKGFVWQALRLAGLVAALSLAARVARPVGRWLASAFSFVPPGREEIVGWAVVLVGMYLLVAFAATRAKDLMREEGLAVPDRALGAALGALWGFGLVTLAFTLWASTKEPEDVQKAFRGSVAARWTARATDAVKPLFPPGVRARWSPVLDSLD